VLAATGTGVVGGLAGCLGGDGNGATPTAEGGSSEPYKLALLAEMSGQISTVPNVDKGMEVLSQVWNDKGGLLDRELVVEAHDSKGDPEKANQLANDLVNNKNFDALAIYASTPSVKTVQNFAAREQIPLLSTSSSGTTIVENCNKYSFRTGVSTRPPQRALCSFMIDEYGSDVYQVNWSYSYGYDIEKAAVNAINSNGGNIVGSTYHKPGTTDFSAPISKIKSADPDWVQFGVVGPGLTAYLKQANQQGLDYPHSLHLIYDLLQKGTSADLFKQYPIYTYRPWRASIDTQKNKEFLKAFKSKVGSPPGIASAQVYAHVDAYLTSIEQAGAADTDTVISTFPEYTTEDSLYGPFEMRPCDQQASYPTSIVRFADKQTNARPSWDLVKTVPKGEMLAPCDQTGCSL
jgi:branched-chain amino acid transport system substrate-binding protein